MPLFSRNKNSYDVMFQKIYDTYWNRMFAMVSRKVKDRDDVLDILQNIFFHLWNYRKSLTQQNAESVIIKTCIQEISNFSVQQKKIPYTIEVADLHLSDDSSDRLMAILEEEKELEKLRLSIELLPPARKKIFTMNKFEGITQETIANNLNLSSKAVKKQISKAMLFLREHQNHS